MTELIRGESELLMITNSMRTQTVKQQRKTVVLRCGDEHVSWNVTLWNQHESCMVPVRILPLPGTHLSSLHSSFVTHSETANPNTSHVPWVTIQQLLLYSFCLTGFLHSNYSSPVPFRIWKNYYFIYHSVLNSLTLISFQFKITELANYRKVNQSRDHRHTSTTQLAQNCHAFC